MPEIQKISADEQLRNLVDTLNLKKAKSEFLQVPNAVGKEGVFFKELTELLKQKIESLNKIDPSRFVFEIKVFEKSATIASNLIGFKVDLSVSFTVTSNKNRSLLRVFLKKDTTRELFWEFDANDKLEPVWWNQGHTTNEEISEIILRWFVEQFVAAKLK